MGAAIPATRSRRTSKTRRRCCLGARHGRNQFRSHRRRRRPRRLCRRDPRRAAGLKTALVEREHLGGICLNWGCIPTKALLRSVRGLSPDAACRRLRPVGDNVAFDPRRSSSVRARCGQQLQRRQAPDEEEQDHGVRRHGKLAGAGKLAVTKDGKASPPCGKHIILATGARARTAAGLEPTASWCGATRSDGAAETMPKSLLVIGSGAIGIEFASFYRTWAPR
jgi:dihydrolipoamide dehydrogenase